ncbi:MAG: hypothetical protein ACI83O_000314 [Patescibacteria group bacterium]|jgi:hypothetical protein
MVKEAFVRDSSAEFLIFQFEEGGDTINLRVEDESVWLTQQMIADLFDKGRSTIAEHLASIYASGELERKGTCRKFRQVGFEGERRVQRDVEFYNLDAVISVGYRVNSVKATRFRVWATNVLREFTLKGYVLDKKRLENGSFLGKNYFEELFSEIREIRLSERNFYQKITDIYATSLDYDLSSALTKEFFAKVQNKLHYAIHRHTASELILKRANASNENMGLRSWKYAPDGKIVKLDVSVAKNYLTKDELDSLGRIVSAYLDLAEERAKRKIPMTMEDWSKRLDLFLEFDDREVLLDSGKVTAGMAKEFAEGEFEKFRVIQNREYRSDFDALLDSIGDLNSEL